MFSFYPMIESLQLPAKCGKEGCGSAACSCVYCTDDTCFCERGTRDGATIYKNLIEYLGLIGNAGPWGDV